MPNPSITPLPEGVVITNGGQRCDANTGPCACGAWHRESQIEQIRKDHAAMAAHNAGQAGMPQGPCQCPVCKS